jgi:hypothetical protein
VRVDAFHDLAVELKDKAQYPMCRRMLRAEVDGKVAKGRFRHDEFVPHGRYGIAIPTGTSASSSAHEVSSQTKARWKPFASISEVTFRLPRMWLAMLTSHIGFLQQAEANSPQHLFQWQRSERGARLFADASILWHQFEEGQLVPTLQYLHLGVSWHRRNPLYRSGSQNPVRLHNRL